MTPDIEVRGAGPAGSVAAILLARAGCRVEQECREQRPAPLPPEILSPWSLTFLDQLGIPAPRGGTACDGVLSRWEGGEPGFHDYQLMYAQLGLAVHRRTFHRELGSAAEAAGVRRIPARHGLDGRATGKGAYVLHAEGRSPPARRHFEDRLVALFMSCRPRDSLGRLIIEAVEDGWWYLPPQVGPANFAVLVTDPETLRYHKRNRSAWLCDSLEGTIEIAAKVAAIDVSRVHGMDARVATSATVAGRYEALVGDAALALDPLSGSGIARCLESAARAVLDIVDRGRVGPAYQAWVDDVHREEMGVRAGLYARAAARFPGAAFWDRRIERLKEQQSKTAALVAPPGTA